MDGITFGYLSPQQWLYLRHLCDGQGVRLDSAAALAHARACRTCVYRLAEIADGRPAAPRAPETVILTEVLTAVAA